MTSTYLVNKMYNDLKQTSTQDKARIRELRADCHNHDKIYQTKCAELVIVRHELSALKEHKEQVVSDAIEARRRSVAHDRSIQELVEMVEKVQELTAAAVDTDKRHTSDMAENVRLEGELRSVKRSHDSFRSMIANGTAVDQQEQASRQKVTHSADQTAMLNVLVELGIVTPADLHAHIAMGSRRQEPPGSPGLAKTQPIMMPMMGMMGMMGMLSSDDDLDDSQRAFAGHLFSTDEENDYAYQQEQREQQEQKDQQDHKDCEHRNWDVLQRLPASLH